LALAGAVVVDDVASLGVVVDVVVDDVAESVDVVVLDVVVLDVVVDGVVGLVVVTGVGSVVPANAAPGTTRMAATARVPARARAAAGRALRRVRCMVPLQCERCRDGCTGTRT